MRNAKFRCWNKVDKEIQSVRCIDFRGDGAIDSIRTVKAYITGDDGDIDFDFPLYPPDDIILMQSTGQHDENGKEIYDGDICKVDDGDNVYEVIFYMGGFMLAVLPRKIRIYHMSDRLFSNIEVIGNIYENPELLETARHDAERKSEELANNGI